MKVTKTENINVTCQELFKELRSKLNCDSYRLIDGVVHRYERSSWDEYDYEPVEESKIGSENMSDKIRCLTALEEVRQLLNKHKNNYTEPKEVMMYR